MSSWGASIYLADSYVSGRQKPLDAFGVGEWVPDVLKNKGARSVGASDTRAGSRWRALRETKADWGASCEAG